MSASDETHVNPTAFRDLTIISRIRRTISSVDLVNSKAVG